MASSTANPVFQFSISGTLVDGSDGRSRQVLIDGSRAAGGGAAQHLLQAVDGEDVVRLHIAGGPRLTLHPAHAQALLAQAAGAAPRSAGADPGPTEVPAQIALPDAEAARGVVGRIVLQAFEVFKPDLAQGAALALARKLEAQVSPGVHALQPQALSSLKDRTPLAQVPPSDKPLLVLVHGTFSSTAGTFKALWEQHPSLVRSLFAHYGQVLALEHHSVTQSPFENAIRLLRALPAGATLHLLTHSRGGLVAEVLARAMRQDGDKAFDAIDRQLLAGADRQAARDELATLNALVAEKRPRIQRVLRVAAPARGTLLASGRLDAYLGVLEWALRLAELPVLPELVDFITAVARERTDPQTLPGLEAMIPGRAVSRVLTREDLALDSDLRVVAGDIQGDSVLSWLKVLATDAFYWTSHDLVVNTDSMYGGQTRLQPPRFVFERGAEVSHFRYFGNAGSAQAVADGLLLDEPPRFQPIGPRSWQGQASDGVRARRQPPVDTKARPALFVLPGIMGSHLAVGAAPELQRIWLSYRAILLGDLDEIRYPNAVTPQEPIADYYGELIDELSDDYDVIPFAFDWRQPIEESAKALAARLDAAMNDRAASGLPVRVLAHSMGGLVMRTVQLVAEGVWNAFIQRPGARFVMAGTPNRGSFAPMLALSRRHPQVNLLDLADTCNSWRQLRQMIAAFPGLIQLQARQGGGLDLALAESWQRLSDWDQAHPGAPELAGDAYVTPQRSAWGLPAGPVLAQMSQLRARLDAQLERYQSPASEPRVCLVAGQAEQTVVELRLDPQGLQFLATAAGDGTVSWDSLRLPGVPCWRADAEHGDLLRERSAFTAYRELLDRGDTQALPRLEDKATRGGETAAAAADTGLRPWRELRRPYVPTLAEIGDAALGSGSQPPPAVHTLARNGPTVEVCVLNDDLTHVRQGLLVGHYRSEALTGAEKILDAWVGGTLSRALALDSYPNEPQQVQVFPNLSRNPFGPSVAKPDAVIVAGLGDENALTPAQLGDAVQRAVLAWALHLRQRGRETPPTLELASLLLGTGGWRIEVAQSAAALAQGVCEANLRLAAQKLPLLTRLTVVELYADRASAAHEALSGLQGPWPLRVLPQVAQGPGARSRPLQRYYRGADYDVLRVQRSDDDRQPSLTYTVHSRRARAEELEQRFQREAVDRLVDNAETQARVDDALAHALFNLLVPLDLRPQLADADSILLDLDDGSAALPWELLRNTRAAADNEPLAVRASLLRTLRRRDVRRRPQDNAASRRVLVIGEPRSDPLQYRRLPGARREAAAVAALFQGQAWQAPPALLGAGAQDVLKSLYADDWRVVHVAGHGDYVDYADPRQARGGVVLEDGIFLGAQEIDALATVPELVFVNCCHLGRLDGRAAGTAAAPVPAPTPRKPGPRPRFAATIASQLIDIGVRCVVVAGWAVDDRGAERFATTFYGQLLQGKTFADAVQAARRATWAADRGSSTWAAYQCYGDPTWRLHRARPDGVSPDVTPDAEAVPTPTRTDLLAALEELRWLPGARTLTPAGRLNLQARLLTFEKRILDDDDWRGQGELAEAVAEGWAALGDLAKARDAYQRALEAADGRATQRAAEQLANLDVRLALAAGDAGRIAEVLQQLQQRAEARPTLEAWSLIGSAHKRLAWLAAGAKPLRRAEVDDALARMTAAYAQACRQPASPDKAHYPRLQFSGGLLLQHLLAGQEAQQDDLARALIDAHDRLQAADRDGPDFWSSVGQVEWEIQRSLAIGRLAAVQADLAEWLARVRERGGNAREWASVRDNLAFQAMLLRLAGQAQPAQALDRLKAQVDGYAA
ncbi:MAG: CHAT domain-containing protein [Rubrivivax sp.]